MQSLLWLAVASVASLAAYRVGVRRCRQPIDVAPSDLLRSLPAGLAVVDQRDRIQFCNEAFAKLTGHPSSELTGADLNRLPWILADDSRPPWRDESIGDQEHLVMLGQPDQSRRLLALGIGDLCVSDDEGSIRAGHTIWLCRDVTHTEHSRAETESILARVRHRHHEDQQNIETLTQLVQEDPLTRCRNRRALTQQSSEAWQQAMDNQSPLACLMFDIDHFKRINDDHGHAAGDDVLRRVAATLRQTFAGVGHVYRYGGEEFCVLLPRHQMTEAAWIGERVRTSIASLQIAVGDDGQPPLDVMIEPTVSVGVSDRSQQAQSADELIAQADKCLYIAKRRGRNQVVAYDAEVAAAKIRSVDRD
ncbi:MAG: sensor domain-containing diguanylate cyclase [Planctomycetota bacterium]